MLTAIRCLPRHDPLTSLSALRGAEPHTSPRVHWPCGAWSPRIYFFNITASGPQKLDNCANVTVEAERWPCWRPRAGEDLNTGLPPDGSLLATLAPLPPKPLTPVHALLHGSRSPACVSSHAPSLIVWKLRNKTCPLLSLWVTTFSREQIWLCAPQGIFSIHTGKDGIIYCYYVFIKTFCSEMSELSTKCE